MALVVHFGCDSEDKQITVTGIIIFQCIILITDYYTIQCKYNVTTDVNFQTSVVLQLQIIIIKLFG